MPTGSDAEALALARTLSERWFRLKVEDGQLVVRPGSRLSEADRDAIRRHRDALIAIVQRFPETGSARSRFFEFDPKGAFGELETVH
jgi:hypothetical protein